MDVQKHIPQEVLFTGYVSTRLGHVTVIIPGTAEELLEVTAEEAGPTEDEDCTVPELVPPVTVNSL